MTRSGPDPTVVVTGIGCTTPLGGTAATTWTSALAGESGARTLDAPWVSHYELPVTFAAQLRTPADQQLTRVEAKRLDPTTQYAVVAAREAWSDAGAPAVEPERLAVVIGTGIGGIWTLLTQWDAMREKGARRIYPLAVPMLMANGPAAAVSLELGARAGAHAPVSACASGAEALASAAHLIRSGRADVVVAGGTEAAVHALPVAAFAAMQALSTRNDDPQGASRPFDSERDGFVLGEGAGIVVLESQQHARARGAASYARLAGVGLSADAHHVTAPEPEGWGASRAMSEALTDGGLAPGEIVHVNAHATSTPVGDVAEAAAIRKTFAGHVDGIPVTATKSMTGHLLGAAGAVEAILTLLAVHHRLVPPTINTDTLDPQVDLDVVRKDPRGLASGDVAALSNSFGFGGHNVSLAFASV